MTRPPVTIGYARVSMTTQSSDSQIYEIQRYAAANGVTVDKYVQETISSRKALDKRALSKLLADLQHGDTLIIAELSRIGRSLFEVMALLGRLLERGIQVYAIKQNWWLGNNLISKVQAMGFSLSADLERDLISQRTKDGLARAIANGRVLGRRKGCLGAGKLNGQQEQIVAMLKAGKSVSAIARIVGVHRLTVAAFIKRYGLNGNAPIFESMTTASAKAKLKQAAILAAETPLKFIDPAPLLKIEVAPKKVWAYLRVSTDKQTNDNQQIQIAAFAERKGWEVAEWCEETISSRRKLEERAVWQFVNRIESGEVLVIAEISRLGRSQGEVLRVFELLLSKGVLVYSVRDNYCFSNDAASKTIIGCIAIAAQIERELISQRTTEALRLKVAQGVVLGRPKDVMSGLSSSYYKFVLGKKFVMESAQNHVPIHKVVAHLGIGDNVFRDYCLKILGCSYQDLVKSAGFERPTLTAFMRQKDYAYELAKKGVRVGEAAKALQMSAHKLSENFRQVFGCFYHSLRPSGRESWPEIMVCGECSEQKPQALFYSRNICKKCQHTKSHRIKTENRASIEHWRDPLFLAKELINKAPKQVAEENGTTLLKVLWECRRNGITIVKPAKPAKEKKVRQEGKRPLRADKKCKRCNVAHKVKTLRKHDGLCEDCVVLTCTEEYDAVRAVFEGGGIIQVTGKTKQIACNGQYFCKTCKTFKSHDDFDRGYKSKCKPCSRAYNRANQADPENMRGKKYALAVMEMHAKGMSYEDIKAALGVANITYKRVISYLKASNLPYPSLPAKARKEKEASRRIAPQYENKQALEMALALASVKDVAKALNAAPQTIYFWAKKHGIIWKKVKLKA